MCGKTVKHVIVGKDIKDMRPAKYENPIINLPGKSMSDRGHFMLTENQLSTGIFTIGATGSGKTYCTKKMVSDIRKNLNHYSMVVVQAKNDYDAMQMPGDLIVEQGRNANRSVKWNLFKDILIDGYGETTVKENTRQFVKHLFSYKEDTKEPFFPEAAAELLYCIIIMFIEESKKSLHARQKLTNKGLLEFFLQYSQDDYFRILESCGEPGVLKMLLGEENDVNEETLGVWGELVTTTLQTLVDIFAEEGDFSIREFVREKQNRCLFINYDPSYKDTQVKLFGSLINLMLKEVLARDNEDGSLVLVCDELSTLGKIDIPDAVNVGRAKGLKAIVGCQSIGQINSIYGEDKGKSLLAGLRTKLYFCPNDPATKQYMQEDFGKQLVDYVTLSPGGVYTERKEENVLDDNAIDEMQMGEYFAKISGGTHYKFIVD